uniref:Uncharacterized protein n=1 Tax=Anguilla anguilla TaxID=7936 RepID=A0A0E9QBC6_ANGAN
MSKWKYFNVSVPHAILTVMKCHLVSADGTDISFGLCHV